jgi:drug/metabolite transporter (DMT)-like permease
LTDQNKSRLSFLCLFLTAAIWGFAFVAQVRGMEFMGAFTFGGVRFAVGTLSLLPVILLFERKRGAPGETKQTLLYGSLAGVVLFAASTLQQYGILLTQSAGKSGFITGLYTVLTPVFSIALGKKPGLLTGLGAVSAFAGLYFLSAPGGLGQIALGDGLLLGGAVFWTLHIMVVDAFAPRVRPIRFSAVQFAVCALFSLIAMALFEQPSTAALWAGRVPLLYGALLSVGVAYTLQIVGQRHVEPSKAAIVFSLESLFAALGGFLLLRETLGWKGCLGGALMFLGIVLSQMKIKKKIKSL